MTLRGTEGLKAVTSEKLTLKDIATIAALAYHVHEDQLWTIKTSPQNAKTDSLS